MPSHWVKGFRDWTSHTLRCWGGWCCLQSSSYGGLALKSGPVAKIPPGDASAGLPLPLHQRTWSGFILGAVCATAGVATWSFVVGGSTAFYLDARMGTAAMLAGGLLGQFLVTLAGVPASTKYGIETVVSTRPQLGVRGGSNIALGVVFCTTLGWNIVLMIFFGRAMASVLELLGLLDSSSKPLVSTVLSVAGVVFVWFLVSRGASSLKQAGGPVIAVVITLMAVYLFILLVKNHGIDAIFAAQPLAPTDRLVNYTTGIEILLVSTLMVDLHGRHCAYGQHRA